MIELTFEDTPLGFVRVRVERSDREGFGTWDGRSLRLSARDEREEQARVFDSRGRHEKKYWAYSSRVTVDGTASFDRSIPGWMQTDALRAAFDEFCKGDQTPLRVVLRPQKNPSFDGSNFFDVIILRGDKDNSDAIFSFAGSTIARSTQSLREIRGMVEGDFPFPAYKVESITYECADAQPVL